MRKKFHMRAVDLAKAIKLTVPKSKVLRSHLGIDGDQDCLHVFEFGKSAFPCFSDNARNKMKHPLAGGVDMNAVWKVYKMRE